MYRRLYKADNYCDLLFSFRHPSLFVRGLFWKEPFCNKGKNILSCYNGHLLEGTQKQCSLLHTKQCRTLLTGEKPCINKAIHALLMHGYATFNMIVMGPQICCRYEMYTARPRTSIVRGNYVRETSVKRRNKIVQEITRNVANVFSFLCNNSDRTWFFMH